MKKFLKGLGQLVAGGAVAVAVVFGLIWAGVPETTLAWCLAGGLATTLILGYLVYFIWAPRNIFFTFVKEGTAKMVMMAGQAHKVLIQWNGKALNDQGDVVDGVEKHQFGGLRWIGLWPICGVYVYKFEWTGVKNDGTFQHHPPEWLDYVLVREDVYGIEIGPAEDVDGVPMNISLTATIQIRNPYKALFCIQNWIEALTNRVAPHVRGYVVKHPYRKLQEEIDLDQEIWKDLREDGVIAEFLERYGIEIRKIEVGNIDPGPGYRESTTQKYRAKMEVEARAQKTMGSLIAFIAEATGKKPKAIQQEIGKSPKLRKQLVGVSIELVRRQQSIDGKAFFDQHFTGAGIGGGTGGPLDIGGILSAIAAWKMMPGGGAAVPIAGGTGKEKPGRKRGDAPPPAMTDEEVDRMAAEMEEEAEEEEEQEKKKKEEEEGEKKGEKK